MVHLGQAIGPIAVTCFAGELPIRQRGNVKQRERNVSKERCSRVRASIDEFNGAGSDLGVHASPTLDVQLCDLPGFLALARFVDGLGVNEVRVPALFRADRRPHVIRLVRRWPHGLGIAAWDAVPLVEALLRGDSLFRAAEMPLPPRARCIALRRQQLCDGDLPLCQPFRGPTAWDLVSSGADGKAARHERGPGGRTLSLNVEVQQAHALAGELVDARRGRAAQDAATIDAQLTIAEVVHEDQDDVGPVLSRIGMYRDKQANDQHRKNRQRVPIHDSVIPHQGPTS